MAPNVSGNPSLDHDAITNLVYSVLKFSLLNASPGSSLLSKTFNGANHAKLIKDFEVCYEKVKIFKPPSIPFSIFRWLFSEYIHVEVPLDFP